MSARTGWLLLGGAVVLYLWVNRSSVGDLAQSGVDDVTAVLTGWKAVEQGPVWVPVINTTESTYGIPADLLARMAYQESHFRPDIITGVTASAAGALGILQLLPTYFQTVRVSPPFSAADTVAQISESAQYLKSLYAQFGDWGVAVGAYNMGPTAMTQYLAGTRALPTETSRYVSNILGDVPLPTSLSV